MAAQTAGKKGFQRCYQGRSNQAIGQYFRTFNELRGEQISILHCVIKNYINLKQIEDESLVNYTQRFKSAKKIMETQIGGKLELPKLAKLDLKKVWDTSIRISKAIFPGDEPIPTDGGRGDKHAIESQT